MSSRSAEQKIIKERVQLLLRYPFFGYLALGLALKEEPEVGTMATDGERLFFNPAFVNCLPQDVLQAAIAHEVLHCAFGHLWRIGAREKTRWNHATDHAINLILKKEGLDLPKGCLLDNKFEGMEAEKIYAKLLSSSKGMDGEGAQAKLSASSKGRMIGSHEKWPSSKKLSSQDESASAMVGREIIDRAWNERLVRAANAARMQGKLPGSIDQMIRSFLEPQLDWRVILSDMITSSAKNNFRLIPPAKKHLWRGIYLPAIDGETLEIAVAVDTSGSISGEAFQKFLAEIKGITEQFDEHTIHLFFCDAAIHERITLTAHDEWPEQFPKRGGGTNFVPVFDAIANENLPISALVYLTDGWGLYPALPPDYSVIWVLSGDYTVPWGDKIIMEDE